MVTKLCEFALGKSNHLQKCTLPAGTIGCKIDKYISSKFIVGNKLQII